MQFCFTVPLKKSCVGSKSNALFCCNTSLEPTRKAGSERPKSSNYLVRRCKRTLRKFSLWRCFGGVQTPILKRCDWKGNTNLRVTVHWWILVVWVGIARLPNHHTQTINFFASCSNLRTTKLPYIKGLGCRGIWISPIFQCLGGVSKVRMW